MQPSSAKKEGARRENATPLRSSDSKNSSNPAVLKASLLLQAEKLIKGGFSIIVVDKNKVPLKPWKEFQGRRATINEVKHWLGEINAYGLAIVCGRISGNAECIDFDTKHDVTGTLFEDIAAEIREQAPGLLEKVRIVQTRSGGYHLYYRCKTIEGNQKLAKRPATEQESKENPGEKALVLVETRGEGGYAVTAPTPGYVAIQDLDLLEITPDEREALIQIARDKNQFIEEAKTYNSKPKPGQYFETPWDDYNSRGVSDMLERLQNHGWELVKEKGPKIYFKRPGNTDAKTSGDFHKEKNLFAVFTTSSVFEPEKGYKPAAVFTMLECNGDFKRAAKMLLELGYGRRMEDFGDYKETATKLKLKGKSKAEIKEEVAKFYDLSTEENDRVFEEIEKSNGPYISTFWTVSLKEQKGQVVKSININQRKLEIFLSKELGVYVYRYQPGSSKYTIIRKIGCLIEEVSTEQIKKLVKQFVESLPEVFDLGTTVDELLNVIYKGANSYFSESYLEFLDLAKIDLLKDTADAAYFKFRNGVVEITKTSKKIIHYNEIEKHIWKGSIKDFDISLIDGYSFDGTEYYNFLSCVCGNSDPKELDAEQAAKLFYCLTLIGYILHKFKDPAKTFAVILAEEISSEEKGGGTGKGLFHKALGHLVNIVEIDGKSWKSDKSFVWQRVTLETEYVAIEDVPKSFDFEKLYNVITEGITIERKNQHEIYLPYCDSPKIGITTNYVIPAGANHSKRRQKVFEFHPFFSPKRTPEQHFGHKLFYDWDDDEWNRFYNLLFACVGMYMDKGILQSDPSLLIKQREIKQRFSNEFFEWMEAHVNGDPERGILAWTYPQLFTPAYEDFIEYASEDKNKYSQKKFRRAMEFYCEQCLRKYVPWHDTATRQATFTISSQVNAKT